jgi:hypothetical protein
VAFAGAGAPPALAGSDATTPLAVQADVLDTALSGLDAPLTLLSRHPPRSGLPDLDAARDDVVRTATTELSGLKGQVAGLRQLANAAGAAGDTGALAAASALAEQVSGRIADLGATLGAAFSGSTDEAVRAILDKALADADRALALADFAGAAARTVSMDASSLAGMMRAVSDARTALSATDPDSTAHADLLAAERELVELFDTMLGASLDILARFERGGTSTNGRIIEAAVDQILGLSRSTTEDGLVPSIFAAPASSAGIALLRDVMLDWYPPRLRADGGADDFADRTGPLPLDPVAAFADASRTDSFLLGLGAGTLSRLMLQSTWLLPAIEVVSGTRRTDEADRDNRLQQDARHLARGGFSQISHAI